MKGVDRDTFIQQNMGLVGMVVNKLAYRIVDNPFIDREDLTNIGTIGLIKAYDRFDPNYGTKFSTYAVPMIMGEIQRYLRENLDTVRFTRQSKIDYYAIVESDLLNEKPEVIADTLEMPIVRVENALNYHRCRYTDSLDREVYEDEGSSTTLADTVGMEVDFDSNLEIELFLNKLDERTRKIVELRMADLGQVQVGKIMGISQAQVSRILKNLQEKLKGGDEVSEKKLVEEKATMKKEVIEIKTPDYVLARKLAIETEMTPSKIQKQAGISYTTAYNYVKQFRVAKEEKKEVIKEILVEKKTLKENVIPDSSIKHRLDIPEEAINKPEINPADGFMTMTFNLTVENATNQLEDIINAMDILGFKDFNVTIQSQQVA